MAIRSPTAHTPGTVVRQFSSTTTNPRSFTSTPVASSPSVSGAGRRPTEMTTVSTVIVSPSPKLSVTPSDVVCWPVTATPVRMSMPRFLNERSTTRVASSSQPGRILGAYSRIVTLVPRSLIMEANSQPMAPPPITTAVVGRAGIDSSSSEVTMRRSSTGKPSRVRGSEPAARITASPVMLTSPEAPPLIETV